MMIRKTQNSGSILCINGNLDKALIANNIIRGTILLQLRKKLSFRKSAESPTLMIKEKMMQVL